MRAIITGAPIELDGEPAEIAQLVELLTSGTVMVEHVHRWRIAELDGSELVKGSCWCGQTRDFNPQLPEGIRSTSSLGLKGGLHDPEKERAGIERRAAAKGTRGGVPTCKICGVLGHNRRTCPQRVNE